MRNPLQEVASWAPEPAQEPPPSSGASPGGSAWVESFIGRHRLQVRREGTWNGGGRKWELECCPFNAEHVHGSAVITQGTDGKLGFKCQHHSCVSKHWKDLRALLEQAAGPTPKGPPSGREPKIVTLQELSKMELPTPKFVVENIITGPGAWTLIGSHKTGKTLFAAQLALSYHASVPFLDYYRTLESRGVLFIEQDDSAGLATVRHILELSPIAKHPEKFFTVEGANFTIGPELVTFLQREIQHRKLGMIVLDSYTAMRGARSGGVDVVKAELNDFSLLDALAKQAGCVVLILHHKSRGNAALDWSEQGAGTFAVGAATEGEIHISRFRELSATADERLVRIRGRRMGGLEAVIRFRKSTLDFEFVMEGGAAELYPSIVQIRTAFSTNPFTPKSLSQETGIARASAFRLIARLRADGVLARRGYGEYVLEVA